MKEKIILRILEIIAHLPLAILYLIADGATLLLYHVVKYRRKIVEENLKNSFPKKTPAELKRIEKEFYRYLGDQIVETLKLLHISDLQLRKRVKVINYDLVNSSLEQGHNAVLLLGHYNNWEWVQEITRYFLPSAHMISIYHPLHNKIWDNIFIKIRSRWRALIIPQKQAPRKLLSKSNMPWVCGFIADARPAEKLDKNWIKFLNHKTWFIYGPEEIGDKVNAHFFYLEMIRKKRGFYQIIFHPLESEDTEISYPYTRQFWKEFEHTIEKAPAYWLWSHKRWK